MSYICCMYKEHRLQGWILAVYFLNVWGLVDRILFTTHHKSYFVISYLDEPTNNPKSQESMMHHVAHISYFPAASLCVHMMLPGKRYPIDMSCGIIKDVQKKITSNPCSLCFLNNDPTLLLQFLHWTAFSQTRWHEVLHWRWMQKMKMELGSTAAAHVNNKLAVDKGSLQPGINKT